MKSWIPLLLVQTLMLGLLVVFFVLSYSMMEEKLNSMQEYNHKIQIKISESIDTLLLRSQGRPLKGADVLQVATRELKDAIALEHEERRAWLDHLNLFATLAIGLLALFAVFVPAVLQFSLQGDVRGLHKRVETLEVQMKRLDTMSSVIQRIDLYRLQSSLLNITAPQHWNAQANASDRFVKMMTKALREVKGRIDEIRSKLTDGILSDDEPRSLVENSMELFSFNLSALKPLDVFADKATLKALTEIEASAFNLLNDISKKTSWQKLSDTIGNLIDRLDEQSDSKSSTTSDGSEGITDEEKAVGDAAEPASS